MAHNRVVSCVISDNNVSPRNIPSDSLDETNSTFRADVREQSRQVTGLKLDRLRPDVAL